MEREERREEKKKTGKVFGRKGGRELREVDRVNVWFRLIMISSKD